MVREYRTGVLRASRFEFESQIPAGILYRERAARRRTGAGMAASGCTGRKKRPGYEPRRKEENN